VATRTDGRWDASSQEDVATITWQTLMGDAPAPVVTPRRITT